MPYAFIIQMPPHINQASQNLSLDWKGFNVAPQEKVNFVQPSAVQNVMTKVQLYVLKRIGSVSVKLEVVNGEMRL